MKVSYKVTIEFSADVDRSPNAAPGEDGDLESAEAAVLEPWFRRKIALKLNEECFEAEVVEINPS